VAAVTVPAFRSGDIYVGWRQVLSQPDPGPPPRRPAPEGPQQLNPGWVAAQRREERLISRPFKLAFGCFAALTAITVLLGQAGALNVALTGLGIGSFSFLAVRSGREVWRGNQDLRERIAAEERRLAALRAADDSRLVAAQQEHAVRFRAWQACERTFARQPQWYPVTLTPEFDRIDVVGGTLAGWSALLTMVAMPRLATGGEITVIDLSEGGSAQDLIALAQDVGLGPLVWVLPGDLPRFDLGVDLPARELADVLASSTSAGLAAGASHDPAGDQAIVARVLDVLGDGAGIAQVTAALRALGQVGDPRGDLSRGVLTSAQLEAITGLFGRGAADRVVIERAWALEARLRVLEHLGTDQAPLPRSRLRVVALDRSAGVLGNGTIGSYVTVSLTHLLRQAPRGRPWRHTLCVAGAEKLAGEVLDRLTAACESTRTGLVVAYRCVPTHVKERLGRGNAAFAVMRLGNADDAKVASEQIGTQHRFVISQLTDTVGASITDSVGDSYTSTVGRADSWSESLSVSETSGRSRGRGKSRADIAPFGPRTGSASRDVSQSRGTTGSESITEGINTSTSWGVTTSRAVAASESLARTAQRSREFLVEPYELQQLPPSAVIVSYASARGRQVVLADANPAIATLPTATLLTPEEARQAAEPASGADSPWAPEAGSVAGAQQEPAAGAGAWQGQAAGSPGQDVGSAGRRYGPEAEAGAWRGTGGESGAGVWKGKHAGSAGRAWHGSRTAAGSGSPAEPPDARQAHLFGQRPPTASHPGTGSLPDGGSTPKPVSWRAAEGRPPPNLGPPPEPLDWRKRRRRRR
jgi:hypothetical protein